MFTLMFWIALATGSLAAVAYHQSVAQPKYRRDYRQAMGWLLLIWAGAIIWLVADVLRLALT